MSAFQVNDKIRFGRPNGEKTLGLVKKVNRMSLKVQLLEARGARGNVGLWSVAPGLCELVERGGKPVTKADAAHQPAQRSSMSGDDQVVVGALTKLTAKEIKALSDHFRKGYIAVNRF